MIKKVFDYIEEHHMLSAGDTVIAGISGGADSVCLLMVLMEARKRIPFTIHAVHINHQIRQEAILDENFVKELCRRLEIPCHIVRADVEAIARKKHITTEEAGREVRYEAFEKYFSEFVQDGHGKIAVAHNKNDSAETVLFHLFRGSGIQGLTGIMPVRDHIIRPLLCVERAEIEDYLAKIGQPYCTDQTNLTDDYARNRIRHHVLDYAKDKICKGAVAHTQEAAEKITEVCEFLNRMSYQGYQECVTIQKGYALIHKEKLMKQDKVLRSYIVMQTLSVLIGTKKDIAGTHIDSVLELFEKQPGKRVSLPYGYIASREYEGVTLAVEGQLQKRNSEDFISDNGILLEPEKDILKEVVLEDGKILEYGIFTRVSDEIIPQKTYTKWFDYDKIEGKLMVRRRAAGDYLTVNDKGQKQTLKAFFINEKIPRSERASMELLANDNHIVWIIGSRISSYYKVGEDTKLILKVNLRGGARNG